MLRRIIGSYRKEGEREDEMGGERGLKEASCVPGSHMTFQGHMTAEGGDKVHAHVVQFTFHNI